MSDDQTTSVDIPEVGTVDFPATMSPDDINAAARRLHQNALASKNQVTAVSPDEPDTYLGGFVKGLKDYGADLGSRVVNAVKNHPVEVGAMGGAALAAPFTGGGSLSALGPLVPVVAAGAGGAGGAGLGLLAKAARGDADTPQTAGDVLSEMGQQGALQVATEGGGALASKGLQLAGRGMYRMALRPIARLTDKYGDLVQAGLDEAAPVGASRIVQGRMAASKAATDQLVQQAEAAGQTVPTSAVTYRFSPLVDVAANREALGTGAGDFNEIAAREAAFNAQHPTGQLTPTQALALKREADTLATTAQNQVRRGVAPTDMTAQLNDATRAGLKQGLEDLNPAIADQNARTSTLYGLSRALRTAENRPHALTNLASVGAALVDAAAGNGNDFRNRAQRGLLTGVLLRGAMSPWAQSRLGIAANAAADLPYAQLARLALLASLANEPRTTTPGEQQTPAGAELLRR